jgi:hypothetical protein
MKPALTRFALVAVVLLAVIVLAPLSRAQDKPAEEVKPADKALTVVGVAVAAPEESGRFSTRLPFRPGTHVYYRLACPKGVIGMDEAASSLSAFADDTGKSLVTEKSQGQGGNLGSSPSLEEDHKAIRSEFMSDKTPAAGAKALLLKGTLAIKVGAEPKDLKIAGAKLKEKAKLELGSNTVTVGSVTASDKTIQVDLTSSEPLEFITSVSTVVDGKKVEADISGSGRAGDGAETVYSRTYSLPANLEKIEVTVTYFSKIQTQTVAVDLKVGLGL